MAHRIGKVQDVGEQRMFGKATRSYIEPFVDDKDYTLFDPGLWRDVFSWKPLSWGPSAVTDLGPSRVRCRGHKILG